MRIRASVVRGLVLALLCEGALIWNTGGVLNEKGGLILDMQPRRFWEDLSLAVGYYKTGELPVAYDAVQRWDNGNGGIYYRERDSIVTSASAKAGASPWHFWRTAPPRATNRLVLDLFPRFDDSGRPLLLGVLFRLAGGVAPFLFFWMGALFAFPILCWLAIELDLSGRPVAAALTSLGLGLSAFLADALSLSYSAAGFYVLGLLLLAAFAAATCLRSPGTSPLLVKSLWAGTILAFLVVCRSGTLSLLPGFLLAALSGAWPAGRVKRWLVLLMAGILLVVPTMGARTYIDGLTRKTFARRAQGAAPPQHHAVWFGIWTGLGDFDDKKGYVWNDAAASALLVQRGGSPLGPGSYDPRDEAILRGVVVADVLNDPGWYAAILVRRLGSTLMQWTILPWPPLDGTSTRFGPASRPFIASYYTLTAHADVFRLYPAEIEIPLGTLILTTAGLFWWRVRAELVFAACVGAGGLVLPVLVTTAGAIETMAFALTYILGTALVIDVLVRRRRKSAGAREAPSLLESRMNASSGHPGG